MFARVLAASCCLVALGCTSPELRPPHTRPSDDIHPAEVETRQHAAERPETTLAAALASFARDVASAVRHTPGHIAVFPPLSPGDLERGPHVTPRGERLALSTDQALRRRGLNTLGGKALLEAVQDANRGLAGFTNYHYPHYLARRIGAAYVVSGELRLVSVGATARLTCRRTADGEVVARLEQTLPLGDSVETAPASHGWRVGTLADAFTPDAERELTIVAGVLARQLAERLGDRVVGKRVFVEPTLVAASGGPLARLRQLEAGFARHFDRNVTRAAAKGSDDPARDALAHGPVEHRNRVYETLDDFLAEIADERERLEPTPGARLSRALGAQLAGAFRTIATRDRRPAAILSPTDDLDCLLAAVRRDTREFHDDGAPGTDTAAWVKAKGARHLVRSSLRPTDGRYRLLVVVIDLETGKAAEASADLLPLFTPQIDRLTTSTPTLLRKDPDR